MFHSTRPCAVKIFTAYHNKQQFLSLFHYHQFLSLRTRLGATLRVASCKGLHLGKFQPYLQMLD
jgi:hypothetical protein